MEFLLLVGSYGGPSHFHVMGLELSSLFTVIWTSDGWEKVLESSHIFTKDCFYAYTLFVHTENDVDLFNNASVRM